MTPLRHTSILPGPRHDLIIERTGRFAPVSAEQTELYRQAWEAMVRDALLVSHGAWPARNGSASADRAQQMAHRFFGKPCAAPNRQTAAELRAERTARSLGFRPSNGSGRHTLKGIDTP